MMKRVRNLIYIIGLVLSLVFIGLFIFNKNSTLCSTLNSIGTGLLGAIVLGWCLEQQSKSSIKAQNKKIFQVANYDIFTKITGLLIITDRVIGSVFRDLQLKDSFLYENKSIEELINMYIADIDIITEKTAPAMLGSETVSQESSEDYQLKRKAMAMLKNSDKEFVELRHSFDNLKNDFNIYKNLLLVNDNSSENLIFGLSEVLNILGSQKMLQSVKQEELIEYGKSLKELVDCNHIDVLNAIGFDKMVFNNKKNHLEYKIRVER